MWWFWGGCGAFPQFTPDAGIDAGGETLIEKAARTSTYDVTDD